MLYRTVARRDEQAADRRDAALRHHHASRPASCASPRPIGFGTVWVTQRLREFIDLYPDIRVELILNDEQVDIAMRAADVAIWTREPEQADLIRRPLFTSRCAPSRRPSTSAGSARRRSLDDLEQHRIISYSGQPAQHLSADQLARDRRPRGQGSARAGVPRQQRRRHASTPSAPASASA